MMPIELITWQEAMTLWYQKKAEILSSYNEIITTGINRTTGKALQIAKPAVIKLIKSVPVKFKRYKRFSKENVLARDQYKCQYCGKSLTLKTMTYDHVIPESRGGKKNFLNIVSACTDCNQNKRNRTPEEAGMKLFKIPIRPTIKESFYDIVVTKFKNFKHDNDIWSEYIYY